jgi:hypothetical protein
MVQSLVMELGSDVNHADKDGVTSLIIAAQEGHLAVVRYLVKELGADVNHATHNGRTPLIVASGFKHSHIVNWLVKHGADVQASSPTFGTAADISSTHGAPSEQTAYLEARTLCANPGCGGAGLKKCAGCLTVFFCGPACQVAHWWCTRLCASEPRS